MATQFTITKVNYGNTPISTEVFTFQYKLWSATSYILISNTAVVNTDGTLVIPLTVTGLTAGQLYYIQAFPNCSSPVETFTQQVQL
jgi:hypothetical protein